MEDEVLFTMDSLGVDSEVNNELEEIKVEDTPLVGDPLIETPVEEATNTLPKNEAIYQALFDEIKDVAGITDTEKKIQDLEGIREALKSSYDAKSSSMEGMSQIQKDYLEALKAGVPEEQIKERLTLEQQLNNIDEDSIDTDGELRKSIIYQGLLIDGMSEDKASKQVDFIIKSGADIETAKEYLGDLKEHSTKLKLADIEKAKVEQTAIQKEQKKYYDTLKSAVEDPKDYIGEVKLTKEMQAKVLNTLTNPVEHKGNQVTELNKYFDENPAKANVVLSYFYNITDGFKPDKIASLNPTIVKKNVESRLDKLLRESDGLTTDSSQNNLILDNNGKEIDLDKVADFLNNQQ